MTNKHFDIVFVCEMALNCWVLVFLLFIGEKVIYLVIFLLLFLLFFSLDSTGFVFVNFSD